jgi:hypothetical protein
MRLLWTLFYVVTLLLQQPKAVIEGVVQTSGTNVPIPGAQVIAASVVPGETGQTLTDSEGRFTLSVNPGSYRLLATSQGFVPAEQIERTEVPGAFLTLSAGQRLSRTVLQLLPTGTITGRIFDPEGNRVEGATVSLWQLVWTMDGRRQLQPATFGLRGGATNDLGEYRLYWIPPGEFYLTVRDRSGGVSALAGNLQRYVTTYYPGVIDAAQASLLTVPAGVELGGINVTLSRVRSTTVRGRLVSPVADVADSVTIIRMAPLEESLVTDYPTVTFDDRNKTFIAPNVLPGRYRILATLRIPNKFNLSGEVILNVSEDPVSNVTLAVTPSKRLNGRVQVDDNSPEVRQSIADGKVDVTLTGDPNAAFLSTSSEVAKDASFSIPDVGIVRYRLNVLGLPPDAYIASARLGGVDILEKGLTLQDDPPSPLEISISGLGGRIVGIVRTAANEIPTRARVVLVPEPRLRSRADLFKVANTDQYGRFNLQGITPGSYKLFALESVPSGAYYNSDFLRPYEDQAKVVTVDKNDYVQAEIQFTPRVAR